MTEVQGNFNIGERPFSKIFLLLQHLFNTLIEIVPDLHSTIYLQKLQEKWSHCRYIIYKVWS